MKITETNGETGVTVEREATTEEIAAREAEVAEWLSNNAAREEAEAQSRALKISAYQKLGLTEAEIEALFLSPKPLS